MLNIAPPTTFRHARSDVTCCAIAKDQTIVATATAYGGVYVWEASSGALVLALEGGHQGKVNSLTFNRDAAVLASGGEDGVLNWWFLEEETTAPDPTRTVTQNEAPGSRIVRRQLGGHDGAAILCCAFAPSLQIMASGGKDCDTILWGSMGRPVHRRLRQHTNWVTCLAFNPTATILATGSYDHSICIWDIVNIGVIRVMRHHDTPLTSIAVSIEGSVVASGDEGGTVLLCRMNDGTCLRVLRGHEDAVSGVGFIDNLGLVLTAGTDGTVKAWELRGKCMKSFRAHTAAVTSLAVSIQDEMLLTTGEDHCARLFPYAWANEAEP